MKAHYKRYVLNFKRPRRTSRGVLTEKETWFLFLTDGQKKGVGECGLLRGLSFDDCEDYEDQLKNLCRRINENEEISIEELQSFPSIQMGYEMALMSIKSENTFELFPSVFSCVNKNSTPRRTECRQTHYSECLCPWSGISNRWKGRLPPLHQFQF